MVTFSKISKTKSATIRYQNRARANLKISTLTPADLKINLKSDSISSQL